jgi:2-oxoglutarate ferredoxin oxidoreductase subunit beta
MISLKDFESDIRPDWCPGCGDFGVLAALKDALVSLKIPPHNTVIVSGIGCSSNLPGYIKAYGFHGLHGRPVPVALGIKNSNPELTVIVTAGDGDEYGIGFNHVVHAARRNDNIVEIVMNNEIYGLTTGQLSPTSRMGQITKTTPYGSVYRPLNPLTSIMGVGGTFVSRGFSGQPKHLSWIIQEAIKHRGFALVDVISPCVTWFDIYDEVKKQVFKLEDSGHDPSDLTKALQMAGTDKGIPIGIFYRREDVPTFQEMLQQQIGNNPATKGVKTLDKSLIDQLKYEYS